MTQHHDPPDAEKQYELKRRSRPRWRRPWDKWPPDWKGWLILVVLVGSIVRWPVQVKLEVKVTDISYRVGFVFLDIKFVDTDTIQKPVNSKKIDSGAAKRLEPSLGTMKKTKLVQR